MKLSNNSNNHRKPALKKSEPTETHRECKQLNPLKERNTFFSQRLIVFFFFAVLLFADGGVCAELWFTIVGSQRQ